MLDLRGSRQLAQYLAEGCKVIEAAKRAGIARKTATTRLADPEFRRHVAKVRAEALERANGKLAHTTARAVEVLSELLEAERESIRLHAARTILENALRMREALEVEERLQAIEARLEARDGPGFPARRRF